jgi:hypothetical protein
MLGRSAAAERHYRAERAVAADESVSWVVVDEDLELHVEACAYLAGLRGAGRAFNTEKTYAGPDRLVPVVLPRPWAGLGRPEPSAADGDDALAGGRADAVAIKQTGRCGAVSRRGHLERDHGTVGEFLSWCSLQGWVPPTVVNTLTQPRFLRYLPAGFDPGEDGQHRTITARTIKYRVAIPGYEWLTDEEIDVLLGLARHDRDRFLIQVIQPVD